MPRPSWLIILIAFFTLAAVVAITLEIWPSKIHIPFRTALLTADQITDDRERLISDASNTVTGWVDPMTVNDSEPQLPVENLYAAMADPPPGCQEAHCMEYLTLVEKRAMMRCDNEIRKRLRRTPDDGSCNFMDGRQGRLPVALASPAGSGNTWVRGLLERASGICTGYSGCDFMIRGRGFIGEGIRSGSALVVKTHEKPQWYGHQAVRKPKSSEERFGSAIYILRNPYNSAVAEWNRVATNIILIRKKIPHNESHTNVVASEYFTGEDILL